jgi:hypothetical protein
MRIVALVFGLFGVVGSIFLIVVGPESGYANPRRTGDVVLPQWMQKDLRTAPLVVQNVEWIDQEQLTWLFYSLCVAVPLGAAACILVWYRLNYFAVACFVVAFAVPFALCPNWELIRFIFGFGVAAFVLLFLVIPNFSLAPSPLQRC